MSTGIHRRYPVEMLSIGMFVTKLEMPQHLSPFPLLGFYIKSRDDLALIKHHCDYAIINITKSKAVQQCSAVLQLDVVDIPSVIHKRDINARSQIARRPRKRNVRSKGRVKRLFVLFSISAIMLYFLS